MPTPCHLGWCRMAWYRRCNAAASCGGSMSTQRSGRTCWRSDVRGLHHEDTKITKDFGACLTKSLDHGDTEITEESGETFVVFVVFVVQSCLRRWQPASHPPCSLCLCGETSDWPSVGLQRRSLTRRWHEHVTFREIAPRRHEDHEGFRSLLDEVIGPRRSQRRVEKPSWSSCSSWFNPACGAGNPLHTLRVLCASVVKMAIGPVSARDAGA